MKKAPSGAFLNLVYYKRVLIKVNDSMFAKSISLIESSAGA